MIWLFFFWVFISALPLVFPHFEALKNPTKLTTVAGPRTQKQVFLEPVSHHRGAATAALGHLHTSISIKPSWVSVVNSQIYILPNILNNPLGHFKQLDATYECLHLNSHCLSKWFNKNLHSGNKPQTYYQCSISVFIPLLIFLIIFCRLEDQMCKLVSVSDQKVIRSWMIT